MKVNYQERIEDTVTELKIIMSQQRTITNRQKVQALYLLKSGWSPSITDVAELVRVHRITVLRLFKQYSEGGLSVTAHRNCVAVSPMMSVIAMHCS
jgi:putative transposase